MTRGRRTPRTALLGDVPISLAGDAPAAGEALGCGFSLSPARCARAPLTAEDLARGRVVVSTLPNIQRHACVEQVLDLEKGLAEGFPGVRLAHVSADDARHWKEVDSFHPDLGAPGYSLEGVPAEERRSFARAFGVAVEGHARIAHGLFALEEGRFVLVDIPEQQMGQPDVARFLKRLGKIWRKPS